MALPTAKTRRALTGTCTTPWGPSTRAPAEKQAREDDDGDAPATRGEEVAHGQGGRHPQDHPDDPLECSRERVVNGRLDDQEHGQRREVGETVRIDRKCDGPGNPGAHRYLRCLEELGAAHECRHKDSRPDGPSNGAPPAVDRSLSLSNHRHI